MNKIHLSPLQKAELKKAAEEEKAAFEKKLVKLMIEERFAVVPVLKAQTNGIFPTLTFEKIPDEQLADFKKRMGYE